LPQPDQQDDVTAASNVVTIDKSEAQQILADLRGLRRQIIDAWHERGVILSKEEQQQLRDEIKYTCELLSALTSRG
jgi:uncharacterized protein YukE